jgi:hypothetical protein
MIKAISGLGLLFICAYVFVSIHESVLATKEKVSEVRITGLFGNYGGYLEQNYSYILMIILILMSLFALVLIVWGCFFDSK